MKTSYAVVVNDAVTYYPSLGAAARRFYRLRTDVEKAKRLGVTWPESYRVDLAVLSRHGWFNMVDEFTFGGEDIPPSVVVPVRFSEHVINLPLMERV